MTTVEQIDYMIQSLKLAKDEIEYAEEYMKTKEKEGEDFYKWGHMGDSNRVPNGTIIRELVLCQDLVQNKMRGSAS